MKKVLLIFILIQFIFCSVQGLTNDYDKLSEMQKSKIVPFVHSKSMSSNYVFKINGNQLKEELKTHKKSLVYIFKNGCTSDYCKPLVVYENFANKNGYQLFLVMNGYANLDETLKQNIKSNLYVIDSDFYETKYRNAYLQYFENDLCNKPREQKNKEYLGNLFFFSEDKLQVIMQDLPK